MFVLFVVLVTIGLAIIFPGATSTTAVTGPNSFSYGAHTTFSLPVDLFFLAVLVPSIAVQVRRFHDQDKSGWMCLIGLIPFVGGIVVLVFMLLEGTKGPNRFGPDPKGENYTDVFR